MRCRRAASGHSRTSVSRCMLIDNSVARIAQPNSSAKLPGWSTQHCTIPDRFCRWQSRACTLLRQGRSFDTSVALRRVVNMSRAGEGPRRPKRLRRGTHQVTHAQARRKRAGSRGELPQKLSLIHI
eukprot:347653-Alexandrium_andersonii.AAC.1